MEAEIGKLGYQKGVNEDVKKYAKMLIDDHSKALEELKTLANENTITMPASISETGSEKYNQLN
jgi:putative membrane protein